MEVACLRLSNIVVMPTAERTFTGGRDRSRLHTYAGLIRYHRGAAGQLAGYACRVFAENRQLLDELAGLEVAQARVLEVGCGGRAAATLAFHSFGARVTGIDYDLVELKPSLAGLIATARRGGAERAAKTLVRQVVLDPDFYRALENALGHELVWDGLDVRTMDACEMGFTDGEFDLIFSSAVFEHIYDVDAAAREMARVLKPQGIVNLSIHLFPSVSGGHALDWAYPKEGAMPHTRVPPWDHLRERRFPPHVFLNELRARDYLEIFGRYFTVASETHVPEGEWLLTPELRNELAQWSVEDLTTRDLKVVLRPLDHATNTVAPGPPA